ncbi:MAG: efflux RND transporter periplasmic adaptor subunit [Sandaracinus sp.]
MSKRAKQIRNVLVALIVMGAIGAFAWHKSRGPLVAVERVERGEVVQTIVASGRVLAPARITIASVALGAVRAVHVSEGDRVTAGQLVVELDDRELQAQLQRARASVGSAQAQRSSLSRLTARVASTDVERAEASVAQARATVARYERLAASDAISGVELENARTTLRQAEAALAAANTTATEQSLTGAQGRALAAGVDLARADVATVEARLAQTRIVAPADGVVLRRAVEPGDVAQPGVVLLEIATTGDTTIRIDPDESTLSLLHEGLPAIASAEAFPDERFEATVASIAPSIDAERGTVDVRLRVTAPPAYLRTDMTVSVEIEAARHPGVLSLSADAVRDVGTAHPWVLRVAGDRVERREVHLGLRGQDVIELRDGIDEGERVVPSTEAGIEPGARVRPREPTP